MPTVTTWAKQNLITVVTFLFGLGVVWGTLQAKQNEFEKRITDIELTNPQEIRWRQTQMIIVMTKIETVMERNITDHEGIRQDLAVLKVEIKKLTEGK